MIQRTVDMTVRGTTAVALIIASQAPARAFEPTEERTERVFVELGGAALGGTLGMLGGALVGLGICEAAGESGREWGCIGPAFIGGAVGAWWGIAGGITLGGEAMGANGGFGYELLGQLAGTAGAGALFWALDGEIDSGIFWGVVWIGLPIAGGILGYELSTERTGTTTRALTVPLTFRF